MQAFQSSSNESGQSREAIIPLSQLLPYNPNSIDNKRLKKALNEYFFLLKSLRDSVWALENHKYEQFDPLVGENACQIRAVKIAQIAAECLSGLRKKISILEKKILRINSLLKSPDFFKESKSSFQDLLTKKLEVYLTPNEVYLLQSYILTLVKVPDEKKMNTSNAKKGLQLEKTDVNKLKQNADIGTNFANKIVRILREQLSKKSTEYVRELAAVSADNTAKQMVSAKHTVTHNNVESSPSFWMSKLLLEEAQEKGLPIVVCARNRNAPIEETGSWLYFAPGKDGYSLQQPNYLDLDQNAMVMEGCYTDALIPTKATLKRELKDPVQLFLAFAAAHRQYPDSSVTIPENATYLYFKKKAVQMRCTLEDPKFLFSHIYCNRIANILPFKMRAIKKLLSKYSNFYRDQILSTINSIISEYNLKIDTVSPFTYDNFTITIKNTSSTKSQEIADEICKQQFCFAKPTVKFTDEELIIRMEWLFDDQKYNEWNLTKYTKTQNNPLKFLTDHQHFWRLASSDIAAYASKKTNLPQEQAFDILESIISTHNNFHATRQSLQAMKHGLKLTSIKERSKEVLIKIISDHPTLDIRKLALQKLKKVMGDEGVINALHNLTLTESNIPFRYEIKNHLDGTAWLQPKLEVEIMKYIFSKFKLEEFGIEDLNLLKWIAWSHHCTHMLQNKLNDIHSAKLMVSNYLQYWDAKLSDPTPGFRNLRMTDDPRTIESVGLFSTGLTKKDSARYANMRFEAISAIILSGKFDKQLRLSAVRQCIKYLFMDQLNRPLFDDVQRQDEAKSSCLAHLKQIILNNSFDTDIKAEINDIIELTEG